MAITDDKTPADTGPLLSPAERASEVVFGIIMALSITAALSVGGSSKETTRDLLVAALACNVAWGMVDAAMYLVNTLLERARRRKVVADLLRSRSDEEFFTRLVRSTESGLFEGISPQAVGGVRQWLQRSADQLPGGLVGKDFLAALQIWLLVFAATLPLVVPFLLIGEPVAALRVSQGVAIAMLFGLGMRLGRWTGARPWRSGVSFAAVGVLIAVGCIALGG